VEELAKIEKPMTALASAKLAKGLPSLMEKEKKDVEELRGRPPPSSLSQGETGAASQM